jgi:hypothetical protein
VLLAGFVPLEALLRVRLGLPQAAVDRIFAALILLWGLICVAAGIYYLRRYNSWLHGRRFLLAFGLPVLAAAAAGYAFRTFLQTDSSVIRFWQGEETAVSDRITLGPYPDYKMLVRLKQEGYVGVITLLSPLVPFESVLLEEERVNGERAGIPIHSFPMLPWIRGNEKELAAIGQLVNSTSGRYYVHCYLGSHRVNLVSLYLTGLHQNVSVETLKPSLERGPLFKYTKNRIVVGPMPTDDEWLELLRRVDEVVSIMDPANPALQGPVEELRRLTGTFKVELTERPLNSSSPDPAAVAELTSYLTARDHVVYVLGHRHGNWTWALDTALGGVMQPTERFGERQQFERGDLIYLSDRVVLGPIPLEDEVVMLRRMGVREIVELRAPDGREDGRWGGKGRAWAALYGLTMTTDLPKPGAGSLPNPEAVTELLSYVSSRSYPVYVTGYRHTHWSWAIDAALGIGRMQPTRPMGSLERFERGELLYLGTRWIFGPLPTEDEMLALRQMGVREILQVPSPRSLESSAWLEQGRAMATLYGITVTTRTLASDPQDSEDLRQTAEWLLGRQGPIYVHAYFLDAAVRTLYQKAADLSNR